MKFKEKLNFFKERFLEHLGVWNAFICLPIVALLMGCSSHRSAPLVQTKFQEVVVPVRCELKLPAKPPYREDLDGAKELSKYFLEVEKIAKICTDTE